MTYQFISAPLGFNFAGNIDHIAVRASTAVNFTLHRNTELIVDEQYQPLDGVVKIPLQRLLEDAAKITSLTPGDVPFPTYSFNLGRFGGGEFTCIPGGHGAGMEAHSFALTNWLTWQPQSCKTLFNTPQRLCYAAVVEGQVKVKGYFKDGTTNEIILKKLLQGNLYTLDTTYGVIRELFDKQPIYFDIWVEGVDYQSYTQRYCLYDHIDDADTFMWNNSLGGIDTVIFTGQRIEKHDYESSRALIADSEKELNITNKKIFTKYTGYITSDNTRLWVLDFFNSNSRYYIDQGKIKNIVVSSPNLEHTRGELVGYEFEYNFSKQSKYLNLARINDPEKLEICDPLDEVFSLAPRLSQFAVASLSEREILIPAQYPNSAKWLQLPLSTLEGIPGLKGKDGESVISMQISSSHGNSFISNNISTTLTAKVYQGSEEITDTVQSNLFNWKRVSENSDTDIIWNEQHQGVGNIIPISEEDVYRKATFNCEVSIK